MCCELHFLSAFVRTLLISNCRVEDKSNRYVAEDNIQLTNDLPSDALMNLAGRYFRRYDTETKTFVSNIREEYPDD
jgi:F-box protein 21